MRSPLAPLAAGALLAVAFGGAAQAPPPADLELPPRFEVEVIVFAMRDFDGSEERFEQTLDALDGSPGTLREAPVFDDTNFGPGAPQAAPPQTAIPPFAEPEPAPPVDTLAAQRAEALSVRALAPEELKLGTEYRRLRAISAYVPLLHTGWVQPGLPEDEAPPFDLGTLGVVNPSGTIRVHLSARNFLHVTLDLTYRADGAANAALAAGDGLGEITFAPRYHLAATRTVRSTELHYFDHPAFGVLVRVTPVPAPNAQGRRPAA